MVMVPGLLEFSGRFLGKIFTAQQFLQHILLLSKQKSKIESIAPFR